MFTNPLDKIADDLAESGVSVQFKRKMTDGSLVDADLNQISVLKSKANIATVAQLVAKAPEEEKTAWAIELKDYANELYRNGMIKDAMEKYVECLVAANFGGSKQFPEISKSHITDSPIITSHSDQYSNSPSHSCSDDSNLDTVVVPVLSNLAACAMQLQEWSKGASFAQEALALRPACPKALMRLGVCLYHLRELELAQDTLQRALETPTAPESAPSMTEEEGFESASLTSMSLKVADKARVTMVLDKVVKARNLEKKALEYQKQAMVSAFTSRKTTKKKSVAAGAGLEVGEAPLRGNGWGGSVFSLIQTILLFCYNLFFGKLNARKLNSS